MAEPAPEMTGANFNIRIIFLKKDREGSVEKGLIVEVRRHEEEGLNAGLA
ncbi:MAG: hypothetical protein PVG06_14065 [Desulfobacterales bacterium]